MLSYASREEVKKSLTITKSVEHTINRILDGQPSKDVTVMSEDVLEGANKWKHDLSKAYCSTAANVTSTSSFVCDLPSPPKKRKFVFRRINKAMTEKRKDFYSDSSDIELDDLSTGHTVELNHKGLSSTSAVINLSISDDDSEINDSLNLDKYIGYSAMGEHQMYKSEKFNESVHCISSDDDVSTNNHTKTVESQQADDRGGLDNRSQTNSHVTGSAISNHLYSSAIMTNICDDLPNLNPNRGSCILDSHSQWPLSSTTNQLQTSAFSTESAVTTARSDLDSQDSELCGRKCTKTSGNASEMQKMDREKVRQKKKEEQEMKKRRKDEERMLKQRRREEVQRTKDFEKSKKQAQQAASRQMRPGECLKFMTVIIDPAVLKTPGGSTVLETLQKAEVKYDIVTQPLPNIVTFWREVTNVTEVEPQQLHTRTQDIVENQILLVLPLVDFIELVHASQMVRRGLTSDDVDTLTTYIKRAQDLLEGREITLLIQRLEGYFRDLKTRGDRAFHGLVLGSQGGQRSKGQKEVLPDVARLDVEEVLLDLQMHCACNVKFLEADADLGKIMLHYTRAVAEIPFKKDRLKTCFSFHIEKKGCVRVDKEGQGLATVWRQQLQQFKNVSADMANAIVTEYPSPWLLHQAYRKCSTEKSAEELLKDILVRRGAGVLSTSRRIGKELSRRIHQLLTATDPRLVIS